MNPNAPQQPNTPPQKLIDFNSELEALCKKYQYELRPVLQFDPIRGIFAILQAFDTSPLQEGVPLTPPAPSVEEPAVNPSDPKKNEEAAAVADQSVTPDAPQGSEAAEPVDSEPTN